MREKVGKSRNTVFCQWFGAPEGRKVGSLKRRVRSQLARWEMKNCAQALHRSQPSASLPRKVKVDKLCEDKLCVDKLRDEKLCDEKLCVSKLCGQVVCVWTSCVRTSGGRRRAEEEEAAGYRTKNKNPTQRWGKTHAQTHTHKHKHTHTLTHKQTQTHTHRHARSHTRTHIHTHTHLETPRRETMKWDEMRIHVSSCWVFGFAQLPYWDYCRYTRLIRPCIPLQGIASLHWVCQGVPNAPARWYTNSKRTIETHVLHAWRCTDVSDWNLYATWTSSR